MKNNQSKQSKNNFELNGRRSFIKKYGKYAAATPVAMTTLMTPGLSSAACSDGRTKSQCKTDCRAVKDQEIQQCKIDFPGQANKPARQNCKDEARAKRDACIADCNNNC